MKILHIINTLHNGGAEKILYNISTNDKKNEHTIICLKNGNFFNLNKKLQTNIDIIKLNINYFNFLVVLIKLLFLIDYKKIKFIHTWNYHSDFIGFLLSIFFNKKIVWNIVNFDISLSNSKVTFFLIRVNGIISKLFKRVRVINCSKNSIENHKNIFIPNNVEWIPPGFRSVKNNQLNITKNYSDKLIVFGFLARFHEVKNFKFLFDSFNKIFCNDKYKNIKLIIGGSNVSSKNSEFLSLLNNYSFVKNSNFEIMEDIVDIETFFSNINFFIMTSKSEGFPNSIGEAMSYSVPCISSDVGDVRSLINDKQLIFDLNSKENNNNFIHALDYSVSIYKEKNKYLDLCKKVKSKIDNEFNINILVKNYNTFWEKI